MLRSVSRVGLIVVSLLLGASPAAAITVGTLGGAPGTPEQTAGEFVSPLVTAATSILDVQVISSSVLDAGFFGQIDVFVFGNSQGNFTYILGTSARDAIVDFVNGGGTVYLGLDLLGDASSMAAAFGFTLTNREGVCTTELVTITGSANPITSGPFQPASEFTMSCFSALAEPAPAGGEFLASSSRGMALGYAEVGLGKVYIFADESPLVVNAQHVAMFRNVLDSLGATVPVESASWGGFKSRY